ncbi:hypothetical protein [Streptomyces sp. NPDC047453]|uniref:hypothetical protein n=1 Tax=Streptomyces sp. NPDC047453 TaxID=3154812 RepID=UPI0033E966BF
MTANPYQQEYGELGSDTPTPQRPAERPSRIAGRLLVVSTIEMGPMAGLFFAFDVSVMPGLNSTSDRTFATAMQNFNSVLSSSPLRPFRSPVTAPGGCAGPAGGGRRGR